MFRVGALGGDRVQDEAGCGAGVQDEAGCGSRGRGGEMPIWGRGDVRVCVSKTCLQPMHPHMQYVQAPVPSLAPECS